MEGKSKKDIVAQTLANIIYNSELTVKKDYFLDSVPSCQPFLNNRWERTDLRTPTDRIVLLEPNEELLEHVVQFPRRLVPPNDRIAEPDQALRGGDVSIFVIHTVKVSERSLWQHQPGSSARACRTL
jgi:hypothetical protein